MTWRKKNSRFLFKHVKGRSSRPLVLRLTSIKAKTALKDDKEAGCGRPLIEEVVVVSNIIIVGFF